MAIQVYTETTCDRCRIKARVEGAHGGFPPEGWSSLTMTRRDKGDGWRERTPQIDAQICPACAAIVLDCFRGVHEAKTQGGA